MGKEDSIIELVKAVEKYRIIYDFSLPGHANKDEVNRAWYEVSRITSLSVDDCKEKWRNCRNCWARDLRCSMACGSSNKKKKPYYLSEYLEFLTPFTKLRPPKTSEINLDSSNSPSTVTVIKEEDLCSDNESPSSDSEINDIEYDKAVNSKQKDNNRKREVSDDIETIFMSYLEMKRKKFSSEQDNADMLFFKSILPEMARLTPSQKINFKICILKTLKNIMANGSSTLHEPT